MKFKKKIKTIKNKILQNRVYLWLFLSLSTFLCFLLPGFFYSLIEKHHTIDIEYGFVLLFIPLALFLSIAKDKIVYTVLSLFVIMELIQFGHMAYFGIPLNPFVIETILPEIGEITESGLGIVLKIWYFPFLVLLPYGLLIMLYKKTSKNRKQYHFATFFLVLLLAYFPRRVIIKENAINNMMPKNTRVTIYNSFRSFSGFFFNRLPKLIAGKKPISKKYYAKYIIEKSEVAAPINIIIIFGESVNSAHMSLFGYKRDTTPLLKAKAKNDINFVSKKAISSGVITLVSTNMFFNVQREPDNIDHLISRETDLFMLAKNNGFSTAYFSAQAENLMTGISSNYVDEVVTKEDIANKIKKYGEIYLVNFFKENVKSKFLKSSKNFLVIHQRNIHSPYKHNYELQHDKFNQYKTDDTAKDEYMINSYDNAMLYNDYFLNELLDTIKEETKGVPTYIFFVSDHGEAMGEDGRFGHSFLAREVAEIPFFSTFYWTKDDKLKREMKTLFYPTHYEIGKIIAGKLGYKIINPNEEKGIFYINGPNVYGIAGYITVFRDAANKKIEFK
jgi:glucan phosphoethanolaminetransferase (alkaline phosphatase superfamily)